jgi:hypothetical protein
VHHGGRSLSIGPSQLEVPVVSGNAILISRRVLVRRRALPPSLPAPRPRPPLLNWTVVAGAAGSAVMLVGIVLIWIATHPQRARTPATPIESVAVAPTAETPIAPVVAPELKPEPQPEPALAQPAPAVEVAVRPAPAPARAPAAVEPEPVRDPFQVAANADATPACDTLGTAVEFDANPARAAQHAAKEGKLMMILHVSGNFEDAGFT